MYLATQSFDCTRVLTRRGKNLLAVPFPVAHARTVSGSEWG